MKLLTLLALAFLAGCDPLKPPQTETVYLRDGDRGWRKGKAWPIFECRVTFGSTRTITCGIAITQVESP